MGIDRLETLVGEWEMAGPVTVDISFAWIEDGAYLLHTGDASLEAAPPEWIENSPFPTKAIIGADDYTGTFSYAYTDGRGVARVATMRFEDGRWEIDGRPGEHFHQRFRGVFEDDDTIVGRFETSADGSTWELDFEVRYTRKG